METKTKKRPIMQVFETYRKYKILLRMGVEPDRIKLPPLAGYEKADDPDLIRAPYGSNSSPMERALSSSEDTPWERRAKEFVVKVERKVNGLDSYKRDIIRARYLTLDEPLPKDEEVWTALRKAQWYVGFRYFQAQKSEALKLLEKSMNLDE